jgi:hypothetical protein
VPFVGVSPEAGVSHDVVEVARGVLGLAVEERRPSLSERLGMRGAAVGAAG